MAPALPQYVWLVVVGALGAFGYGYATGANDVANAFATSVGARTLTLLQATMIAAVFEFAGAMLLGRVVTNTIAGGIADPKVFADAPEVYAYGMVCALGVGTVWQLIACYAGYNVSATHTIIGAIIGFALVYGGGSAVQWATPDPASFPPYKGVVPIICSWVFSPLLTGIAASLLFLLLRTVVLRHKNSYNLAYWVLPFAVAITTFINIFFVFTKGAAKSLGADFSAGKAAWISAVCAAGLAVLTAVVAIPLLRRRSAATAAKELAAAADAEAAAKLPPPEVADITTSSHEHEAWVSRMFGKAKDAALYGVSYDIHKVVEEDATVAAIHAHAEKFDPATERVFGYLQVFSAIAVIFAHGAGEVGFMAGPLGAIYDVYQTGNLNAKIQPEIWCVALGAASLVIGLGTYGYNVMRAMGTQLSMLTPSRGFCAELSTALVILVASQLGLPTSSSQCITGGIVGVGLVEGARRGVNWKQFGIQFASWVATIFVVGLGVAALFAQGIYSPSKIDGGYVRQYEHAATGLSQNVASAFNTSLLALQPAAENGTLQGLSATKWATLNETVTNLNGTTYNLSTKSSVSPDDILANMKAALSLVTNNSVFTLGQNGVFPGAKVCNPPEGGTTRVPCVSPPLL